jgi:hypothetical protein
MRRAIFCCLSGLVACFLIATAPLAAGRNMADYPLRVHIYQYNAHSHYYGPTRTLDEVDGEGRANLYENGAPRGFEFSYRCGDRLRASPGYETYMARWKKSGRTLEVLLPQFGKPGAFDSCEMQVDMKDSVYFKHNGMLDEEPAAKFKEWMARHQYDPEKGKNLPVEDAPAATGPGANPPQ